ncbi:MAG: DUF559 domain-containing protein [Chitinispirillaceae bacterium]|nr:DUF559 domain-containing protein [Chitinispirillaceae bacterium]
MEPVTLRARQLRQKQTPAEELVWANVRNRKLGVKIVRQKPLIVEYFRKKKAFIADFYCSEAALVIEIDGEVHARQSDYDALRTLLLRQKGVRLIRFSNKEVMTDVEMVLARIKSEIASPPAPLHLWRGESGRTDH